MANTLLRLIGGPCGPEGRRYAHDDARLVRSSDGQAHLAEGQRIYAYDYTGRMMIDERRDVIERIYEYVGLAPIQAGEA
jgi:hypothetical protein